MFFDSLIRRKQGVFTPAPPSISPLTTARQVFIMNPAPRYEMQPKPGDKKVVINRSKSEKQFTKNGLGGHTKHPILQKQRNSRQIENINIEQSSQQGSRNYESLSQSRDQRCEKHGNNYQNWRSNQKHVDFRDYELKNLSRVSNYYKMKQTRDFNENSNPFIALPPNYVREAIGHSSHKSQLQSPQQSNFFVRRKSSQDVQILSPFNVDEHQNDFLEEETTKLSQAEGDNNLRAVVKSLEKQIEFIKQERNKDKISLDNLKFENDRLKKSTLKSKENIDVKSKDRFEVLQLKKLLKQEGDNRECVQKQRETVLQQLNEALIAHETQKVKWEKQKKQIHHKIQTLMLETKERKNQNILLAEKINFIYGENKKLRQTNQRLENDVREKQKEVSWVNSKVNDLKQALEHLKIHGNSRIQKLEIELKEVEKKRKQQKTNQVKNMEYKVKGQEEIKRELEEKISELTQEIMSYQMKLQETTKQHIEYQDQTKQLIKEKAEDIKKAEMKVKEYENTIKILQTQISLLSKSLDQSNLIIEKLKQQKQNLQKCIKEEAAKVNCMAVQMQTINERLVAKEAEIELIKSTFSKTQREQSSVISEQMSKNLKLENQISNLITKLKQLEIKSQTVGSIEKNRRRSEDQTTNKIVYTQLEMRMCSALGIYLTSNVEKIMTPVQQMIKARKYLEANSKSYEELMRIFQVKEGQSRLISQMREYKTNYHGALNYNFQLQSENGRLKQENSYLISKLQQANYLSKKLQPILQNSNQTIIKLRLKLQNEKYSAAGTRKC